MKLHSTLTAEKIAAMMLDEMSGISSVHQFTGEEVPVPDAERAAMEASIKEMVRAGHIGFICIGCDGKVSMHDGAPCVCGGFVCNACRAIETEGECHHEQPDFPDDADD